MIDRVGTMRGADSEISDVDVVFSALYNLLLERIETEPEKGLIISKGNPNQRKVSWKKIASMAHSLEDFFTFREQVAGDGCCKSCGNWCPISKTSPHMGVCKKHNKRPIHELYRCKKGYAKKVVE